MIILFLEIRSWQCSQDRPRQRKAMLHRGAKIHIGEFGCFKHTPNEIALRWLADLLGILKEFGWGYALWQFQGAFGIIEHDRPGASTESIAGYHHVDRALLDLMLENRLSQ